MSFEWPVALLALLIIPLALFAYYLVQQRRVRYAVRFTNLDLLANVVEETPGWRRHLPAALYLMALAALVIALARPHTTVAVPKEQATVILVTDVSGSMNATDIEPTRLAAAQKSAHTLVDKLPKNFQIGLISFSTAARVLVAPTTEKDQVQAAIDTMTPRGGTAMGEAILDALNVWSSAATSVNYGLRCTAGQMHAEATVVVTYLQKSGGGGRLDALGTMLLGLAGLGLSRRREAS